MVKEESNILAIIININGLKYPTKKEMWKLNKKS